MSYAGVDDFAAALLRETTELENALVNIRKGIAEEKECG